MSYCRSWESGSQSIRDTQCWWYGANAGQKSLISGIVNTTVNGTSAGVTLPVASTTGFATNDYVIVGWGTAREEIFQISGITAGVSLTSDRTLTYVHTAAQADTVFEDVGEDDFAAS